MLTALALLATLAAVPEFADEASKGMPFPFDHRAIPADYHGTWAASPAACRRSGQRLVISRYRLAGRRIAEINGYSDHPAIFVRLRHTAQRGLGISLDVSVDGKWLRRSDGFGTPIKLLQRCSA